jgi:hypothetical protein
LRTIVGDLLLDDLLNRLGVNVGSGLMMIDVESGGEELKFPGWVSVVDCEGDSQLTLVRDFE